MSADTDRNESLSMNEFIDLIFTTNEGLNIDPSRATQIVAFPESGDAADTVIESIRRDAELGKESRAYN